MRSTWAAILLVGVLAPAVHAEEPTPPDAGRDRFAPRYVTTRPEPLSPVREVPLSEFQFSFGADPLPAKVRIDETSATYRLETPPYDDSQLVTGGDTEASWNALMDAGDDPVLYATFREAAQDSPYPILPGLELFGQQSKVLNDGLVAAVELRLERAAGDGWPGKQAFLLALAGAVAARWAETEGEAREAHGDALVFVGTAYLLGGGPAGDLPRPELHARMTEQLGAFEQEPLRSKPIGFYTWTEELSRIFRRDRWLMSPFASDSKRDVATFVALADVLARAPELAGQLRWWIELQGGLTNPAHGHQAVDLVEREPSTLLFQHGTGDGLVRAVTELLELEPRTKLYLVPQATNREADLLESLDAMTFQEGDGMRALIDAVRRGDLSLAPAPDDGWYAHQQYALEILLRLDDGPEGDKLTPNAGYTQRLEMAFASMFAMNRETHVKVLRLPTIGAPPTLIIDVRPELSLEPLPSYYLRNARAYRFVRSQVLEGRFGDGWRELIPLAEGGAADAETLGEALEEMESWFYGLYLVASLDVGVVPEWLPAEIADPLGLVTDTRKRLAELSDPMASNEAVWTRDVRFMVPAGQTPAGGLVTWNVLGVSQVELSVSYEEHPDVTVPPGDYQHRLEFEDQKYTLLVPVFAELVFPPGTPPMTRDEFRALCDRHPRQGAIEGALRAAAAPPHPVAEEAPEAGCRCGLNAGTTRGAATALVAILLLGFSWSRRRVRGR